MIASVDSRTELIGAEPAQALAGLLGVADPSADPSTYPTAGLPPSWHSVYLLERPRQDELGPDGHPLVGVPTPPAPGLARMFASGSTVTHRQLRFGEPATRRLWVAGTEHKSGRSGPLTFITVRAEIHQGSELAVADEQNLVYREPTPLAEKAPTAPPTAAEWAPPPGAWGFDVDEIVLFRFSALTYNSHRIHYDRDFARAEGHADLVVHGPLQALLMAEHFRRTGLPVLGRTLTYRLVAPAYGAQRLVVAPVGLDGVEVRDATGRLTATATLT